MPTPNRITGSRVKDVLKTKITDLTIGHENAGQGRTFYFGQVIDSKDPSNANRLRIRIPLLDDSFYMDDSGKLTDDQGHNNLPWSISAHGRMIDTPENNSVVLVALMDAANPFFGRIWFSAVPEMSATDIFDKARLKDEQDSGAWGNMEKSTNVKYGNTPTVNNRPALKGKSRSINYPVGIRGKDKNKLLLDTAKITLVQNEGVNQKETLIEMTDNLKVMSQQLTIISNNSSKRLHPVLGDPLFKFMQSQLDLLNQIVTLLNSSPGIGNYGAPVAPAPDAPAIQAAYKKLSLDFQTLKLEGEGQCKNIIISA
jgi:hypothetical protein